MKVIWIPKLHVANRLLKCLAIGSIYLIVVGIISTFLDLPHWPAGVETLATLGVVLGVLVVLRNNAANGRWWEARTHWGRLINECRNLALKSKAHVETGEEEFREMSRALAGFPHALRMHLRGEGGIQSVPGFEKDESTFPHVPGYVAGKVHELLNRWNRAGKLRDTIYVLDPHARALMEVCGACERIRNTPLASSYRALVRWGMVLYVAVSPWSVSLEIGWSGLGVLIVGMAFFFGIELTAEVVEEPFGTEGDDLTLEAFCATIDTFVRATLGHEERGELA